MKGHLSRNEKADVDINCFTELPEDEETGLA
jgi:hypothetical protein